MHVMEFDGRMAISQTSIPDRTDAIAQRFFFTRDVAKSECFIFNQRVRLDGNNLHPSFSSKPLIEDEEANPTVTPNFAYNLTCSSTM